jgi:hypothetical protein
MRKPSRALTISVWFLLGWKNAPCGILYLVASTILNNTVNGWFVSFLEAIGMING